MAGRHDAVGRLRRERLRQGRRARRGARHDRGEARRRPSRRRVMEIGTVLSFPGAALAELAGSALDFAWIDLEHGALSLGDMQAMAVGLAAAGCAAHVRLPASDADRLGAVLDAGVDGVVAPRVESAQEARDLVGRLRYPPAGRRGFGPRRAGRFGRTAAFWTSTESRVTCTVQIESRTGVAAAA